MIDGANAVVTGNRLDLCSSGIEIDGSDPSVTRNTLTNTDGGAIDAAGDDAVVESNSITGTGGTGIDLFCDASCGTARIYRNRLTSIGGSAVVAEGLDAGLQIEANQISQAQGAGLALDTLGANVVSNRVSTAGGAGGECIDLEGDTNEVTGQDDGVGNGVLDNQASGATDNGIEVSPDDSQASGVRADCCNAGTGTGGTDVPDDTTGCGDIDD